MKRKDYKEVSPEPKDYGGVTIPMIVARARGRPPEGMTMTCIIGKRCPRRRLPKAPTATTTTTTATMTVETLEMTTLSRCIRYVVQLAVTPSRSSTHLSMNVQAMEAMRQRMEDLEHVVEDDYKFLNRNV
jgi:hypothetical protein